LEPTVPAVAVKVAAEEPAGTETLAGTGNAVPLLLVRFTVKELEAALFRVTVQVAVCPDSTVAGEQARVLSVAGATADNVNVLDAPPVAAVSTELRSVAIDPTVAAKVWLVEPLGTVTEAGTWTPTLELLRFTVTPAAGAAALSVTVQVEVPGAFTLDGVQLSELGWIVRTGSAIEPPDGRGLRSI
jgi:hypothetical protein